MKTSEIFRRVRTHLSDTLKPKTPAHKRYICYALNELYLRGMIGDVDRTRGKKLVHLYLDGSATIEMWLWKYHDIPFATSPRYKRKIMATRKAWLTHLIEHYEAKGD